MAVFGRYLSVCLIWLTTAMTLIASTPHVYCQCPNGNVKPFCLSMFGAGTGCCCNDDCCSTASGSKCCCHSKTQVTTHAKKSSCCSQTRDEGSQPTARGATPGCVKQLQQQTTVTTTPSADKHTAIVMSVVPLSLPLPLLIPAPQQRSSHYLVRLVAPPDDLTTRYLHLVI